MKFKKAFTLAEVLVTLMIIGVIASMTIPGLMRNADDRTVATNLKKIYAELNQATKLAMTEYSATRFCRTGLTDDEQTFEDDFIKKYFNVMKVCPAGDATECFGDSELINTYGSSKKSYLLSNGIAIMFSSMSERYCTYDSNTQIYVDVNGPKKPNKGGTDQFTLTMDFSGGEVYTGASPRGRFHSNNQNANTPDTYYDKYVDACNGGGSYDGSDYTLAWACAAKIEHDGWQIKY